MATILESLDAPRLLADRCLFGGGTAIALRFGEYRESIDIDFMVSDRDGYRRLREAVTGPSGMAALARTGRALMPVRETRADQYGLRTLLAAGDGADAPRIKFEIVFEARIALEPPGPGDSVCGVATLAPLDIVTTKLLALADRWRDDSAQCRDLIDLAMMSPPKAVLAQALAKARAAYGDSVQSSLAAAVEDLRLRPPRLAHCMQALRVTGIPRAALWQRVKTLAARVAAITTAIT